MLFKIHLVPSYHNNNLKLQNGFYLYPLIIPSSRGLLRGSGVNSILLIHVRLLQELTMV